MLKSPRKYDLVNFVTIYENEYDGLNNIFLNYVLKDSKMLNYTIPVEEAYRIDLISMSIYGTHDLDWLIIAINSIVYIEELYKFRRIKFVDLVDVESAYFKYKKNF